ncbi:hypothetical protein [Cryptosporangium sp. NPDC048952]|uniref:hypothetical protein n=1 Tax=Cryptosporangium sp. NPDC048952 TaxID=3363961 RepID=UPI003714197A
MSSADDVERLLAADPLWWLRDPPVPHHLCAAVHLAGDDGQRERVLRALIDALGREHADFADEVVPDLAPSWPGRELFRDWFAGVAHPSPTAVRVLGALFPGVDEVRSLLSADAPQVRGAAVRAMPAANEALVRETAVHDPSAAVRRQALEALVELRPEAPTTWNFLYERAVADPGTEPRLFALRTIAQRRPLDPRTAELLADRARTEPDTLVGSAAVGALEDEPDWDDATLHEALHDRWLGPAAVHALVSRHPTDPQPFLDLATHVHNDTRAAAIDVLATHWPDRPDVRTLVTDRATTDHDHVVRRTALVRTALTWPATRTHRLLLDRAANDPHPDIRTLAAQILAAQSEDTQ